MRPNDESFAEGERVLTPAMVARAALGSLFVAAAASLAVLAFSLLLLWRGAVYAPTVRMEVGVEGERAYLAAPEAFGLRERALLAEALRRIAVSPDVAREAALSYGLSAPPARLQGKASATPTEKADVVYLTYRGRDREDATRAVNALAVVSAQHLVSERELPGGTRRPTVALREARAASLEKWRKPEPLRNGVLTLALGWALFFAVPLALVAWLRRKAPSESGSSAGAEAGVRAGAGEQGANPRHEKGRG